MKHLFCSGFFFNILVEKFKYKGYEGSTKCHKDFLNKNIQYKYLQSVFDEYFQKIIYD